MASKFGGIAVEDTGSKFGGVAVGQTAEPAQPVETKPQPPSMQEMTQKYLSGGMTKKAAAAFEELAGRHEKRASFATKFPSLAAEYTGAGGMELGAPTSTMGISSGTPFQEGAAPQTVREEIFKEMAEEVGPFKAFLTSAGKGFGNVARGLNLGPEFGDFGDPNDPVQQEAMGALETAYPTATTLGEVTGEAAPFVPMSMVGGELAGTIPRIAAAAATGAVEGGAIAGGTGGDTFEGSIIGAGIGGTAEALLPVLGRIGGKIVRRMMGKAPTGAVIDAAGKPTAELAQALDAAGMTFEDMSDDAVSMMQGQPAGANVEEIARKARFTESGVPATKGDISQDFGQQATEQRLAESAEDTAAEPLRQFRLKQSTAIKDNLRSNFGLDVDTEETGQFIQDALTGRKKLLRTQKNELYETASLKAKNMGGLPIFTDNITEAAPDADLLEDLGITAPAAMASLDQILTKYGMKEPSEAALAAGFQPTPLTIDNFERFRKTLNAIEKGDQTGAASVAIRPIKDALDAELADIDKILEGTAKEMNNKIRAYHGTPHEVDKFSMDKIGTGEGAQSYGHGLYFAENPEVAGSYREALAPDRKATDLTSLDEMMTIDGEQLNKKYSIDTDHGDELKGLISAGDKTGIRKHIEGKAATWKDYTNDPEYPFQSYAAEKHEGYTSLLRDIEKGGDIGYGGKGAVYDVDIDANTSDLLDWDKPLSEQPELLGKLEPELLGMDLNDPQLVKEITDNLGYSPHDTGKQLYEHLSRSNESMMTSDFKDRMKKEASDRLNEKGIKGIKFLDQGSRGVGEGTRNIVVFDDELIDIVGKDGKKVVSEKAAKKAEEKATQINDIRESLVGARKTVRQLKTEFSPKSAIGRIVDLKKDGVTPITEASKVYSKLTGAASPVEETRRVVKSLLKAGEKGEQAVASLQASTILDLIDAGFGTESRKVSGVKTFNPIAFKRRLDKIGDKKLKAIFGNNRTALAKLNNIDTIAADLVPPSGAVPKGSASVILDLANSLGMASLATKIPGGALLVGGMKKIAQPVRTGIDVRRALNADPDVAKYRGLIEQQFPGIASAIGIAGLASQEDKTQQ